MTTDELLKIYEKTLQLSYRIDNERNRAQVDKTGGFAYTPLSGYRIKPLLEIVVSLRETGFSTFCDLGCGPNNIGFLFNLIGYRSIGVEISSLYAMAGSGLIIKGDLSEVRTLGRVRREINKENTIFYAYTPIRPSRTKESKEKKFLSNVNKIMRKEDIFIYAYISSTQLPLAKRIFKIDRQTNWGALILKKR